MLYAIETCTIGHRTRLSYLEGTSGQVTPFVPPKQLLYQYKERGGHLS